MQIRWVTEKLVHDFNSDESSDIVGSALLCNITTPFFKCTMYFIPDVKTLVLLAEPFFRVMTPY